MSKLSTLIAVVILAITALVIFFSALPRVDRFLIIRSTEVCSNSAHVIQKNPQDGSMIQYPVSDLYAKCLSETK